MSYKIEWNKPKPYKDFYLQMDKPIRSSRAQDLIKKKKVKKGMKQDKLITAIFQWLKRYDKNKQGYHIWHKDFENSSEGINRSHVCMFYLNDVEDGGETEFYHQKVKIKPKKGTLVIFPSYFTHLHKGHVPLSNDKYIITTWIMPRQ